MTVRAVYEIIYPSQRHHLPPTLKIMIRNFSKYSIIFKICKIQNSEFLSQNFLNHRGAAYDIKWAAVSLLVNSKISIFY